VRRALAVGPAAAPALGRSGTALRVHSVFPSTANLEVEGHPLLVALTGPGGAVHPHAVVLGREEDLASLGLAAGDPGWVGGRSFRIRTLAGWVVVDLARAVYPPLRPMPAVPRLGEAYGACAVRLRGIQAGLACSPGFGADALLARAARALGATIQDLAWAGPLLEARPLPPALGRAVAALVGLGPGLTPAGDDYLCGFLAAARGCRPALAARLGQAVLANLSRTGDISASLLRAAAAGHWPGPLADLAAALAGDREVQALAALDALCRLGHSSGADLAAGFLDGLGILAALP
jgi:hypothetical protein